MRDILWKKLYEAGLPIDFVKILKIGHEGNKLRPKCDGYTGNGENNKGVFQGSPISATIFIIYAERTMGRYKSNIDLVTTKGGRGSKKKNTNGEFKWAEYQQQKNESPDAEGQASKQMSKPQWNNDEYTITKSDALKFSDDATILVNDTDDIPPN